MNKTEKKELLKEFEMFLDSKELSKDSYNVGDVIDFTLTTGENVSAMAMRQEEDGMLFVFIDCLRKEYPMNEQNTNMGGYECCDLRKTLNTEILDTFPDSIKSRMKPVYKEDKLRLLTAMEVFGNNPYGDEDNGSLLPLMKDIRNRIAFQGRGTDIWEWWWLQNSVKDSAAYFAYVPNNGHAHYAGASTDAGVRPAFKI